MARGENDRDSIIGMLMDGKTPEDMRAMLDERKKTQNQQLDALEERIAKMEKAKGLRPPTDMELYDGDKGMAVFSSPEEQRLYELQRRMNRVENDGREAPASELALLREDRDMNNAVALESTTRPAIMRYDFDERDMNPGITARPAIYRPYEDTITPEIKELEKRAAAEESKMQGAPTRAPDPKPRIPRDPDMGMPKDEAPKSRIEILLEKILAAIKGNKDDSMEIPVRRPRRPMEMPVIIPRDNDRGIEGPAGSTPLLRDNDRGIEGPSRSGGSTLTYALNMDGGMDARIADFLKMNGKDPQNPENPGAGRSAEGGAKPTLLAAAMPAKTEERGV